MRDADLVACAFLIGLRSKNANVGSLVRKADVPHAERDELGTAEGTGKAESEQSMIPDALHGGRDARQHEGNRGGGGRCLLVNDGPISRRMLRMVASTAAESVVLRRFAALWANRISAR